MPFKGTLMAILISPMIVPLIYYSKYYGFYIHRSCLVGCRNVVRVVQFLNLIPRRRSDLLLNNSTLVNNAIDKATKHVAIHKITGLVS